jgi:hypothetical protein
MSRALRSFALPVVASLIALSTISAAQAAFVPPGTVELRPLGPGSGNGIVFVDAMQQASPWRALDGRPLRVDPEGNLVALEPGRVAERIVYADERYPAGDYTLLYAGDGRFEAVGASLEPGGGPGRIVAHVQPNDGAGLRIRLTAMDQQNPVRNVRLILPGFERVAASHPFYPAFVRSLQGANVLRFTEWMRAGTHAESAVLQLRPRVARPTQASENGAAVEYMTLLANLTGANPWFSVPAGATDGYVRAMAQAVRRTVDPSLRPVVQYADERMLQPGSPTNGWALMAARNFHIGGDNATMVRTWYARRSAQIQAIFAREFANEPGRVLSADSPSVATITRGRANPNAVLVLGLDVSPFVAEHKPPARGIYRPGVARTLAAPTLDLAGLPGVKIGLGEVLPDAEPTHEGASVPVLRNAAGAYSVIAPADTTERVLRVYARVERAAARLTVELDGKTYAARPLQDAVESRDGVYTVVYRAARPGDRLVATLTRDAGSAIAVRAADVYVHDLRGAAQVAAHDEVIYHNDLEHTGWNKFEPTLNTSNVSASSFGQIGTLSVDGGVLAQPLYVHGYKMSDGKKHNVVVVATENASVYEFDADSGAQLGMVSLGTAPTSNQIGCGDIQPTYGVTSTPAIDRSTGTIYVVTNQSPSPYDFHVTLHALDIATLTDKVTPVDLNATVTLSNGSQISFDPRNQYSRTSLLWSHGSLYVGVGSHCDNNAGAIVGWLMRYDSGLNQLAAIPTIEDSAGYLLSSIWMSGFAPAAAANGDIFAVTGNGAFDAGKGGKNYGESVIHVKSDLSQITDYFTPSGWSGLNNGDTDFGSGGAMLLPTQSGKYKHLLVAMGKSSVLYLLDQRALGHESSGDPGALQVIQDSGGGVWGGPAFFSGPTGQFVYYQTNGDQMHAYGLSTSSNGKPSLSVSSTGSSYAGYGGSTPVVSSNGQNPGTAILWEVERGNGNVYLEAYDATNLATMLFRAQAGTWPQSNGFVTPLVANGKVFVPAQGTVTVYGLLPPR